MPNALAHEKSPYLLQHAENPVNWLPWGETAFQKAQAENKPIFLSIGYSTCHWCHVMEHESFENPDTAALLNKWFVPVKVDREERPDVDRLYMTFVQATTGSGGWPLSIFLTPQLQPFYGGTYFPPHDAYGRMGFPSLLERIANAWHSDRENVEKSAAQTLEALRAYGEIGGEVEAHWGAIYESCFAQLAQSFDPKWGGFGGAPKFPRPVQHDFLHAFSILKNDKRARQISHKTLEMMATRGLNDQLGGGFHRYSVDELWIVTHFEKMLYDQAQLVISFLEMFQMTGDQTMADAARQTLNYVWRDMTHVEGGFFAAEDADSLPNANAKHKSEGAFYVWEKREIDALLGTDSSLFCARFGVKSNGNAPAQGDPHGEFAGQNILFQDRELPELSKDFGPNLRGVTEQLEQSRETLFEARKNRPRPHRDEKIIVAWNGLMISAFARAAVVLQKPKYARHAQSAAEFIRRELWDGQNLKRHFKDGAADVAAFADDYAALARGCLDLYAATFEIRWLEWAEQLADSLAAQFEDEKIGGFFQSRPDPRVLVRFKEDYDGAEPSASALAVEVGARLFHLLGRDDWREKSEKTVAAFGERLSSIPSAMPLLLRGKMLLDEAPQHVVIAGEKSEAGELLRIAQQDFAPFRTIILLDETAREFWTSRQPFMTEMKPMEGKATAFVCANFACQNPVSEAEALRKSLE